jgi:hypothetical protein
MFKNVCIIMFLSVAISSCSIELESKSKTQTAGDKSEQVGPLSVEGAPRIFEFEKNLKISVKGAEPGRYVVYFSWPSGDKNYHLRFRSDELHTEVPLDSGFFTLSSEQNKNLNFQIELLNPLKEVTSSFSKFIEIPRDFIVDESNYLMTKTSIVEANRVFLSEKWPLTFQNYDLSIYANELHPRQGKIQTYKDGQTAPINTSGKSGGRLSIVVEKLISPLLVEMKGENGGVGMSGAAFSGRNATIVAAASGGELICTEGLADCIRRPWSCRSTGEICHCKRFGEKGAAGLRGLPGNDGSQGGNGGSTGSVSIQIESLNFPQDKKWNSSDENQFVKIKFQAGTGGPGGIGGEGQKGGFGGIGRNPHDPLDCRGEPGTEGSPGAQGRIGEAGRDGTLGQKCVIIGGTHLNHCKL